MKPTTLIASLALGLFVAGGPPAATAAPRMNPDAKALARQLGPAAPAKKFNPADKEKLKNRMIAAIEQVNASYRGNGPNPESFLDKALEFRPDVGPWERLMVSRAVINAWREAHSMDLFDEDGKFGDRIYKGRHQGGRVLFELIIPGEVYAPGSNQLANLRLVPDSEKRTEVGELDHRELAFQEQLTKLVDERTDRMIAANQAKQNRKEDTRRSGPATNALGQDKKEQDKIWAEAVAAAGENATKQPNIRLIAAKEASPSKMNKNRWRVGARFTNASSNPTEIKAEVWLLGITDRKRDYYVMAKSEHTLKLRQGEIRELDFFTRDAGSYKGKADNHDGVPKKERKKTRVNYHGFAIRVFHDGDVVASTGSNARLASWVDPRGDDSELTRLPKF